MEMKKYVSVYLRFGLAWIQRQYAYKFLLIKKAKCITWLCLWSRRDSNPESSDP